MKKITVGCLVIATLLSLCACSLPIESILSLLPQNKTAESAPREPFLLFEEAPELYGNKATNIANGGKYALCDGWVYYANSDDGWKLYKVKLDGSEQSKLTDDRAEYINVADGWVYYQGRRREWQEQGEGPGLYKIRTDGTEWQKLDAVKGTPSYITVAGNWIYYNPASVYELYKIRTDGTENQRVLRGARNMPFVVVGDWIYYKNQGKNFNIYKVRTDGTENTQVTTVISEDLNVVDGWIYYVDYKATSNKIDTLYKVRTDGTEETMLLTGVKAFSFFVDDDWIYFCGENSELHKMRTDGSELTALGYEANHLHILGDWLYFMNVGSVYDAEKGTFDWYRMNKDGTECERVS